MSAAPVYLVDELVALAGPYDAPSLTIVLVVDDAGGRIVGVCCDVDPGHRASAALSRAFAVAVPSALMVDNGWIGTHLRASAALQRHCLGVGYPTPRQCGRLERAAAALRSSLCRSPAPGPGSWDGVVRALASAYNQGLAAGARA